MKGISFALLVILLNFGCTKKSTGCDGKESQMYTFDCPLYYPAIDTFDLGDTVWISIKMTNPFINLENGQQYQVDSFNFIMSGYILDLSTNPLISTGLYDIVDSLGQLRNDEKSAIGHNINLKFQNGTHYWIRGFIMKKKGLFEIDPNSEIDDRGKIGPGQKILKDCRLEFVTLLFRNVNGNNNHYLLSEAADPYPRSWTSDQIRNAYIFIVK